MVVTGTARTGRPARCAAQWCPQDRRPIMKRQSRREKAKGQLNRLIGRLRGPAGRDGGGRMMEQLEDRALLATLTWTGSEGDNWSDESNWSVDFGNPRAPQDGDSLVFTSEGSLGGSTTPFNDISGLTIRDITISPAVAAYTITGNGITIGGPVAGVVLVKQPIGGTGLTHTLNIDMTAGSGAAPFQINVAPGYTLNYGGSITGDRDVDKLGAGRLNLTGNSPDLEGDVNVTAGVVEVSAPEALGDTTGRTFVASGA